MIKLIIHLLIGINFHIKFINKNVVMFIKKINNYNIHIMKILIMLNNILLLMILLLIQLVFHYINIKVINSIHHMFNMLIKTLRKSQIIIYLLLTFHVIQVKDNHQVISIFQDVKIFM